MTVERALTRRDLVRAVARLGVSTAGLVLLSGCDSRSAGESAPVRVPRVGFMVLNLANNSQDFAAFREGMRKFGWFEPQNVTFAPRSAEGVLDAVAAELVRLPADVIVTSNSTCALALQRATRTVPIVMAGVQEPEALGLVTNLAQPGANITGLSRLTTQLAAKRLEILREVIPGLVRLTVLWDTTPGATLNLRETEAAAAAIGLQVQKVAVKSAEDFEAAVAEASQQQAEVVLLHGGLFRAQRTRIAEVMVRARLPSMASDRSYVEAGTLLSYGEDAVDLFLRAAKFVDKILRGAKPADLPVELPTAFEFVVNLKTAHALGLSIPPSVASRVTTWIN